MKTFAQLKRDLQVGTKIKTIQDARRVASWILDKYYDWGGEEWPSYQNASC